MKLHWVTPLFEGAGNVLGYATANRQLVAALHAAGVRFEDDADVAVHFMPPTFYAKIPGTQSVLFSMFETSEIPAAMRTHLHEADLVIVPCAWNVPIFAQYVTCPVVVCPLGIDAATFTPRPHSWRGQRQFRWLHVGAPTGRKGADVLWEVWAKWWARRPDAQLYLKTTIANADNVDHVRAECLLRGYTERQPLLFDRGNLTLDLRRLPTTDLVRLYHEADAFVFPTGNEGWGLVLQEAMACGLPVIATNSGGHLEFCTADVATLLPWTPRASIMEGEHGARFTVESAWVEPADCSAAMDAMMRDYPAAVRRARWGAQRARRFTWDRTANTLLQHLRSTARAAA